MQRAGVSSGPLDTYLRSLRSGEAFYARWVRSYLEDPQAPGDFNGPGTSWPSYPAQWPESRAREIAARVIRLYGEEEGWRNERRFEAQRELDRIIAQEARKDASLRRLDASLRTGRFRLLRRSARRRYRMR